MLRNWTSGIGYWPLGIGEEAGGQGAGGRGEDFLPCSLLPHPPHPPHLPHPQSPQPIPLLHKYGRINLKVVGISAFLGAELKLLSL
nr:hypothetical protein [Nostoc sp. EkiNYC01]